MPQPQNRSFTRVVESFRRASAARNLSGSTFEIYCGAALSRASYLEVQGRTESALGTLACSR